MTSFEAGQRVELWQKPSQTSGVGELLEQVKKYPSAHKKLSEIYQGVKLKQLWEKEAVVAGGTEQETKLKESLTMMQELEKLYGAVKSEAEFDSFLVLFDELPDTSKKEMYTFLSTEENVEEVKQYFKDNWFPTKETFQKFTTNFDLNISFNTNQERRTKSQKTLDTVLTIRERVFSQQEKFNKAWFWDFIQILKQLEKIDGSDNNDENKAFLKNAVLIDPKVSDNVWKLNIKIWNWILEWGYLNTLSENDFNTLMKLIREIDKEEGKEGTPDSLYAQMVAMSASSPELKAKFTLFEKTYLQPTQTTKPTTLTDAERGAILWSGNFTQVGNTFQSVSGDTLKIYDPKTGAVTLKGNDDTSVYKLKSDVPLGDFSEKVTAYEKVKTEHEPKLEKYSKLVDILTKLPPEVKKVSDLETYMKASFLEHFQSFFSAIRWAFRVATGKDMTPDTPIGEVTQAVLPDFIRQRDESKKVLEEAQKKYETELQEYVVHYKEKSKEKEEKLKKILALFKDLGIDLLPNALLDTVVRQLNTSGKILQIDLGDGKKFQNKLDWKKGELGLNEDKKDDIKDTYRRFLNMMLTGKADEPVVLTWWSTGEVRYKIDGQIQSKDRIKLKEKYIVQPQLTPAKILKNLWVQ